MTFMQMLPVFALYSSILCPNKLPLSGSVGPKYLYQDANQQWKIKSCPSGQIFIKKKCSCVPAFVPLNLQNSLYSGRRKNKYIPITMKQEHIPIPLNTYSSKKMFPNPPLLATNPQDFHPFPNLHASAPFRTPVNQGFVPGNRRVLSIDDATTIFRSRTSNGRVILRNPGPQTGPFNDPFIPFSFSPQSSFPGGQGFDEQRTFRPRDRFSVPRTGTVNIFNPNILQQTIPNVFANQEFPSNRFLIGQLNTQNGPLNNVQIESSRSTNPNFNSQLGDVNVFQASFPSNVNSLNTPVGRVVESQFQLPLNSQNANNLDTFPTSPVVEVLASTGNTGNRVVPNTNNVPIDTGLGSTLVDSGRTNVATVNLGSTGNRVVSNLNNVPIDTGLGSTLVDSGRTNMATVNLNSPVNLPNLNPNIGPNTLALANQLGNNQMSLNFTNSPTSSLLTPRTNSSVNGVAIPPKNLNLPLDVSLLTQPQNKNLLNSAPLSNRNSPLAGLQSNIGRRPSVSKTPVNNLNANATKRGPSFILPEAIPFSQNIHPTSNTHINLPLDAAPTNKQFITGRLPEPLADNSLINHLQLFLENQNMDSNPGSNNVNPSKPPNTMSPLVKKGTVSSTSKSNVNIGNINRGDKPHERNFLLLSDPSNISRGILQKDSVVNPSQKPNVINLPEMTSGKDHTLVPTSQALPNVHVLPKENPERRHFPSAAGGQIFEHFEDPQLPMSSNAISSKTNSMDQLYQLLQSVLNNGALDNQLNRVLPTVLNESGSPQNTTDHLISFASAEKMINSDFLTKMLPNLGSNLTTNPREQQVSPNLEPISPPGQNLKASDFVSSQRLANKDFQGYTFEAIPSKPSTQNKSSGFQPVTNVDFASSQKISSGEIATVEFITNKTVKEALLDHTQRRVQPSNESITKLIEDKLIDSRRIEEHLISSTKGPILTVGDLDPKTGAFLMESSSVGSSTIQKAIEVSSKQTDRVISGRNHGQFLNVDFSEHIPVGAINIPHSVVPKTGNRTQSFPPFEEIRVQQLTLANANRFEQESGFTGSEGHLDFNTYSNVANLPRDICKGCTMDGGVGYINHPTRCDQFIVCYEIRPKQYLPKIQDCPYGQFWSTDDITCRPSKDVRCPNDPCRNRATGFSYHHHSNCAIYWQCQKGYSTVRCCAQGFSFNDHAGGCTPNTTCDNVCPNAGKSDFVFEVQCNKRQVVDSHTEYEIMTEAKDLTTGSNIWVQRSCFPGFIFKREICDCMPLSGETPAYLFDDVCKPEVFLPFDTDFNDYSGSQTYVRTENVTLKNGAACFHGDSVLAMPRFANMDMGRTLYLRVRYREDAEFSGTQALVYNGDCDERSSMIIGTMTSGNSFSVRTKTDEYQTMWIPNVQTKDKWRDVTLTLENEFLEGQSDFNVAAAIISGGVDRAACGIKLGWGKGYEGFRGCIDEMVLYRCYPTEFRKIGLKKNSSAFEIQQDSVIHQNMGFKDSKT